MSKAPDPADVAGLVARAGEARTRAYVPYSRFAVGAALLSADGTVFTGCNVENASYGLTVCAERTALFKAVSEGHREFLALAVVADTPSPASPCGACRQCLVEFSPDMLVIMANLTGDLRAERARDLLPAAFGAGDLGGRVPAGDRGPPHKE